MSSTDENNSKHENSTMKNGGSDKPLLEGNGKKLNDVNNASEIQEEHEMANLKTSDANKEDMVIAVDEETPIDADGAVVKKRKGFDLRCLLIGLMVLIVMIGAAAIAILAHKSQSEASFDFRFANYFSNDMVLQRSPYRAVVWGYASMISENSTVQVKVQGQGVDQVYRTVVRSTAAGHTWTVQLDARTETTPFKITAKIEDNNAGKNDEIELQNVFFGDVWICAGDEHLDTNERQVVSSSDELNDNVRVLSLNPSRSEVPWYNVRNLRHSWSKLTKDVAAHVTATCWMFAKKLAEEQRRPVGLINVMYPSTFIYEWAPLAVVEKCDNVNSYNARSGMIWNAMIHPLLEVPFYGVVWSQGRSDALEDSHSYNCTLVEMISSWRNETSKHTQSNKSLNIKFAVVQLAPGNSTTQYSYGYSDLRWRQTANFGFLPNKLIPNSFLVPTIDLPYSNVSSKKSENQNILVERLVREALSSVNASSIIPTKYSVDMTSVSLMLIFDKSNIIARNGPGFEVCCSENRSLSCSSSFVKVSYAPGREWVEAPIIGSAANFVKLSIESCKNKNYIVGIRYLWREVPCEDQTCPIRGEQLNIPMSPYIRFDLIDDGITHDLLEDQVHLM